MHAGDAKAHASGCKTSSAAHERAQFATDLGLTLGGTGVAAMGRFGVVQVRGSQWVPPIDRRVPVNGSHAADVAGEIVLYTAYAAALATATVVSVHCRHAFTLRRSLATPLLEVAWPWLWTFGVGELTKSFAGRPRPYTRGRQGLTEDRDDFGLFSPTTRRLRR